MLGALEPGGGGGARAPRSRTANAAARSCAGCARRSRCCRKRSSAWSRRRSCAERLLAEVRADAQAAGTGPSQRAAAAAPAPGWAGSVGSLDWRRSAGSAPMALVVVAVAGYAIGSSGGGGGGGGRPRPSSPATRRESPPKVMREGDTGETAPRQRRRAARRPGARGLGPARRRSRTGQGPVRPRRRRPRVDDDRRHAAGSTW